MFQKTYLYISIEDNSLELSKAPMLNLPQDGNVTNTNNGGNNMYLFKQILHNLTMNKFVNYVSTLIFKYT